VELTGEWRGRTGGRLPARWRITASARGAALQVPCPRGAALQLTEWLPRRGTVVRGARFASRAGYTLAVSRSLTLRSLTTRYANARQPSLAAARVAVACRGSWTTLRWTGGARAEG